MDILSPLGPAQLQLRGVAFYITPPTSIFYYLTHADNAV